MMIYYKEEKIKMTRLYRSEAVDLDKFEYVYTETRPWVTLAINKDGELVAEYNPSACENAILDYIVRKTHELDTEAAGLRRLMFKHLEEHGPKCVNDDSFKDMRRKVADAEIELALMKQIQKEVFNISDYQAKAATTFCLNNDAILAKLMGSRRREELERWSAEFINDCKIMGGEYENGQWDCGKED